MGRVARPKPPQKLKQGALAPEHQFTLHLTENQLAILEKSLDLYSRIGMGQLKEVVRICLRGRLDLSAEEFLKAQEALEAGLSKDSVPGGVLSISSPEMSDEFRIAYDCQQVVRHGLHTYRFYRNPEYRQNCGAFVFSDLPRRYSAYEPNLPILLVRPWQRK